MHVTTMENSFLTYIYMHYIIVIVNTHRRIL